MVITAAAAAAAATAVEKEEKEVEEEAEEIGHKDTCVTATCADFDACCCTVAPLGRALWVEGCRSRDPFCTPGVTPLATVVGRKDRVCIVLQSQRAIFRRNAGSSYRMMQRTILDMASHCCTQMLWT